MMAREMHVDGQTLYFISDPGGSIARGYLVGPNQGIDVAQVRPWGKMVGQKSISIHEDIDRNRRVARRLAAAWNITRYLDLDSLEAVAAGAVLMPTGDLVTNRTVGDGLDEADSIETDLSMAVLPRSRVHSLLHRLQVVLG